MINAFRTPDDRRWYLLSLGLLIVVAWVVLVAWGASPYADLLDHGKRVDGALSEVRYFPDELVATFVRYADTDPLCCPSRPSVLATYRIVVTPSGPSLEPVDRG